MEKLEVIIFEIEMYDKRFIGIELKRRVLFLGYYIRVMGVRIKLGILVY